MAKVRISSKTRRIWIWMNIIGEIQYYLTHEYGKGYSKAEASAYTSLASCAKPLLSEDREDSRHKASSNSSLEKSSFMLNCRKEFCFSTHLFCVLCEKQQKHRHRGEALAFHQKTSHLPRISFLVI